MSAKCRSLRFDRKLQGAKFQVACRFAVHFSNPAREFRIWIIGASSVGAIPAGPWAGRKCIGCSLVVNDRGEPVEMLPYGEDAHMVRVVRVSPNSRPARGCGWGQEWGAR